MNPWKKGGTYVRRLRGKKEETRTIASTQTRGRGYTQMQTDKEGKDGSATRFGVSIKHSVRKMLLHKNSIHYYATQSSTWISVIATTSHIVARFTYGCL